MDMGSMGWALRMGMQWGGVWLAARGYGDEQMWAKLSPLLLSAAGLLWSWLARRKQIRMEPPR